jgi:hypothetical protein
MLGAELLAAGAVLWPRVVDVQVARAAASVVACADPLAAVLHRAGWRGGDLRVAWAIAMRESNGIASTPNGGLFQLKASVWAGTRYWPAQVSDADSNARASFELWSDHGWRPWGIGWNGRDWWVDARDYGAWSAARQWSWIGAPFARYFAAFPCGVSR